MRVVPPKETRPARMGPLAVLPAFFDLKGKRVLLAGAGEALVWKCELAAAAGAHVEVYASAGAGPELAELASAPPAGTISIHRRAWRAYDLCGAALAIGALEDADARAFSGAACEHGVPVNIVDTPELSTFSFGTVVNRSPVVVAISTAGVAPVLGQAIRTRIEALLHPALAGWAAAAQGLRSAVKSRVPMGTARRETWRRFAERALAARTPPSEGELNELLLRAPAEGGSVALVGAGPGDPELLTLKALRALQSADVILYDRLVSAEILELARREARRMLVGKSGGGSYCRQDEINDLMIKLALGGKRVVRLKGGDPMIFGRAAEEIEICRQHGVPVEIVPGITAALGAAAELAMPLTDRRFAQRLQFITGHAKSGEAPEHDWIGLAKDDATTVFYMGARTFAAMLPQMLAAGLPPLTPAVAISAATTPRSRRVTATVSELPDALVMLDGGEPCLIVVGRCAAEAAGAIGSSAEIKAAARDIAGSAISQV